MQMERRDILLLLTDLQVGQKIMSGKDATPEIGNTMFLNDIPMGTIIHNIELKPGKGAAMARSAGTYAQLICP